MSDYEKAITSGLDWWLRAEMQEARTSRNRVWSNHERVRASYAEPHEESMEAAKTDGHFTRFNLLVDLYPEQYGNDYFVGKVIHHALMFVAGGRLTQCHLQSASQERFDALRFGDSEEHPTTGVDIVRGVRDGVKMFKSIQPDNLGEVVTHSRSINGAIYATYQQMFEWHKRHPGRQMDELDPSSEPVAGALECQRLGLQLAAGHVLLAAKFREDDVTRVPILEPKSISDASDQPIYPFTT